MKFYICKHCKNIIVYLNESGVAVSCCGEPMQELVPNTVDAATEKHVPVFTKEGNLVTVKVGSVAHPMEEKHSIKLIVLETENGFQERRLN
ncbi:MAG: desulfoferrodoxin family protein, partial [Oscillospiraceae bacterium]